MVRPPGHHAEEGCAHVSGHVVTHGQGTRLSPHPFRVPGQQDVQLELTVTLERCGVGWWGAQRGGRGCRSESRDATSLSSPGEQPRKGRVSCPEEEFRGARPCSLACSHVALQPTCSCSGTMRLKSPGPTTVVSCPACVWGCGAGEVAGGWHVDSGSILSRRSPCRSHRT